MIVSEELDELKRRINMTDEELIDIALVLLSKPAEIARHDTELRKEMYKAIRSELEILREFYKKPNDTYVDRMERSNIDTIK